jgi:signal transduction histidine kinase
MRWYKESDSAHKYYVRTWIPKMKRRNLRLEIPDLELSDENMYSRFTNVHNSGSVMAPTVYIDKHGIPVTYDAATEEQKKNRANGLSMLWHELLSPLTVIKGYTSTLLQLKDVITEDEKIKYIQGIESATNRMIRLMENLRDLSRLEEPDNLLVQRISLPDLLRTIVHEMQNQTTKHFIKISFSENMPLVSADPEKITS